MPAPGVADEPLRIDVHLPDGYHAQACIGYPVLYLNDGQDAGYQEGNHWQTCVFEGDGHDEDAWRQRVHAPLAFLLGK